MSVYRIDGSALNSAYDINSQQLQGTYDISGNYIPLDVPEKQWLDTAVITALPSVSVSGTKQGGCTDGTYIYQCSGDSSNYTYMNIIKYKISDGTYSTVSYSGTPNFGHANDMAYNPSNGYLYIATMLSDGSVIVLDADDLSYVDTIYVNNDTGSPFALWHLCYDRKANRFYTTYLNHILMYDDQFDFIESVSLAEHPSATQQGCETDGDYYYRFAYNPNLINVCTLDGHFVKNISNPVSGEPEALMYDWDGNFYFSGASTPSVFYEIQLFEE